MQDSWLIAGGRMVDPVSGRERTGDLYVKGGVISPLPTAKPEGAGIIDAKGLVVVPGLIDLHVHFREPGYEKAETIRTGSEAAACGGFTTVVTMPNTKPATDNAELVAWVKREGVRTGKVRILPSGCITKGRAGQRLAALSTMAKAGAVAFTDDGSTVANCTLMETAMKKAKALGVPIMDHALDPMLAGKGVMHEGRASARHGLPGIPSVAETTIVERDIRLAGKTGCAVHIQHVSCAESVDLIRKARARGIPVSGEATPHHLALNDTDVDPDDANFKMNPPLGSRLDQKAIIEGILDGTLQAFATDHAPHCAADKDKGFLAAPFGIVGLETAVGITYTVMVKRHGMSLVEWTRRWTTGPAGILGLNPPSLGQGRRADIAILDFRRPRKINLEDFHSKSKNTPFSGWPVTGVPAYTFCAGRLSWIAPEARRILTV